METNNIFNKNMQAIIDIFPKIASQVIDYLELHDKGDKVFLDTSVKGEDIVAVKDNERLWYLNSRYNSHESAFRWAEQYKNKNPQAVFIIYGLADGSYARELLKQTRETNFILIYEPNVNIFLMTLQQLDISDLIYSKRIFLSIDQINIELIYEFVSEIIDYGKIRLVEYCSLPNYNIIYPEEWAELIRIVKSTFEVLILDRNTQVKFSNEFIKNMLANFDDMPKQYVINQLKEKFQNYDLSNIPAIIVSAGPSLDKNIFELKKAVGKAFIIVTDTAIKSVLRAGVKPDIVVTVDPHKNPYLFAHSSIIDIPMMVCQHSNKVLWGIHYGKRFYFGDDASFISDIYERFAGVSIDALETGGSVANNCFSLAQYCGFKTILLSGQDLAFSGKRIHASAAYDGSNYDSIEENKEYVEVEDIYGGKLLTDKGLEMYLKWFEKQIIRYPELKVIDATEGGARIQGCEIMSLHEAIDRECKVKLNIPEIINSIEPLFYEEAREATYKEFDLLSDRLLDFKKRINIGIRDYNKLIDLFRQKKTNSKEYMKCLKGVEQINYDIEHTPFMELAALYNRKTEYEIRENVYIVHDNQSDEVKSIVESGIKLLTSYNDAIDQLVLDIKQKGKVNMRELYESLANARVYMSRIANCYRIDKYDNGNTYLNSLIKNLVKAIDCLNNYKNIDNRPFEIDYEVFHTMLSEILKAQEDKDFIYLADLLEGKYISFLCDILINLATNGLIPWDEYEKENLEIIKERYPDLFKELEKIEYIDEEKYQAIITYAGEIAIRIDNRITYSSTVDSFMSGEQKFYDSFDNSVSEYTFVGFNLPWIRAVYNLAKGTVVNVYEHDINVIKMIFKYNMLSRLLENQEIRIIYDPDFTKLSKHLKHIKGNLWIHKPCIENIENQGIKKILQETFTSINSIQNQNQLLKNNFIQNFLTEIKVIDDIRSQIKDKNIIYVSGGPSLDHDIDSLNKAVKQSDFVLMAAGTVVKKLLTKGIVPNFIIISDAKKNIVNQINGIDESIMNKITLLYLSTISLDVIQCWKGKKYMILQKDFEMAETYAKSIDATLFETGGSVSTLAVDLAIRMECKSLVCVGLDLAYTNGKIHATDCKEYDEGEVKKDANAVMTKSVSGDRIQTANVYEIYRRFIESRISLADATMAIYNTSKGAYIQGMKHVSLEELL